MGDAAVIICSRGYRAPDAALVKRISESAPASALWGLSVAAGNKGAPASFFAPGDLQSALAWGLIEPTPKGRRFNPTRLGWAVYALFPSLNQGEAER